MMNEFGCGDKAAQSRDLAQQGDDAQAGGVGEDLHRNCLLRLFCAASVRKYNLVYGWLSIGWHLLLQILLILSDM